MSSPRPGARRDGAGGEGMAPRDGFEPSANRLTAGCSTAELPGSSLSARRAYSSGHSWDASHLGKVSSTPFALSLSKGFLVFPVFEGREGRASTSSARTGMGQAILSDRELLHRDALVERMLGIEQQGQDVDRGRRRPRPSRRRGPRPGRRPRETGRLTGSSTRNEILRSSGSSAPRQRRGRNGLIGVSATSFDPKRQDRAVGGEIVGGRAGRRRHQHAVADQFGQDDPAVDRDLDPRRLAGLAEQRDFVDRMVDDGLAVDASPPSSPAARP